MAAALQATLIIVIIVKYSSCVFVSTCYVLSTGDSIVSKNEWYLTTRSIDRV